MKLGNTEGPGSGPAVLGMLVGPDRCGGLAWDPASTQLAVFAPSGAAVQWQHGVEPQPDEQHGEDPQHRGDVARAAALRGCF